MSIALKDTSNMEWADGSTSPKTYDYDIGKILQTISTEEAEIFLGSKNPTKTIEIIGSHGHITVESSDDSIASIESEDGVITLSSLGVSGSATLTITADESTNYFQSNSITISLTVTAPPELVSWSSGSIDKIEKMINGYYSGDLSLDDIKSVWHLGDSRTVSLSAMAASDSLESHAAQDIELTIIDFDVDTLTTSIGDKTKSLVSLAMKAPLSEWGNYDTTRNPVWETSQRRSWCNNTFYNSFPSAFKNLIKQVVKGNNKITGYFKDPGNPTDDYAWILSRYEIAGEYPPNSNSIYYSYYRTANNRPLYSGGQGAIWTRTVSYAEMVFIYAQRDGFMGRTVNNYVWDILCGICL